MTYDCFYQQTACSTVILTLIMSLLSHYCICTSSKSCFGGLIEQSGYLVFTKKFRTLDPHLPIVWDKVLKKTVFFFDTFPNFRLSQEFTNHTFAIAFTPIRCLIPSLWALAGPRPAGYLLRTTCIREGVNKKNRFFLGLCPKLWVGGGPKS